MTTCGSIRNKKKCECNYLQLRDIYVVCNSRYLPFDHVAPFTLLKNLLASSSFTLVLFSFHLCLQTSTQTLSSKTIHPPPPNKQNKTKTQHDSCRVQARRWKGQDPRRSHRPSSFGSARTFLAGHCRRHRHLAPSCREIH